MAGDKLSKLGKMELAMREYKKSLKLEEVYLGQHHRIICDYHDKLLEKEGSLKRTSPRLASRAVCMSLAYEKEGDHLRRLGRVDFGPAKIPEDHTP
jgi:hypothetical protein